MSPKIIPDHVKPEEGYQAQILHLRKHKDEAFREAHWSPLPHDRRHGFKGLDYYPPDPRYRFSVILEEADNERVEVPLSTGGTRVYTRIGRFRLQTPEGEALLAAYEQEHAHGTALFVPFRDATSGKATYGAGRYLDVQALDDGTWLVDLNLAYNPHCAYSEDYACPLPPAENWLKIPVHAGERYPTK